jgi:hypothetical protein
MFAVPPISPLSLVSKDATDQDLIVSLSEACQTLLGVVWRGLLLLGGAAEEPDPLEER